VGEVIFCNDYTVRFVWGRSTCNGNAYSLIVCRRIWHISPFSEKGHSPRCGYWPHTQISLHPGIEKNMDIGWSFDGSLRWSGESWFLFLLLRYYLLLNSKRNKHVNGSCRSRIWRSFQESVDGRWLIILTWTPLQVCVASTGKKRVILNQPEHKSVSFPEG